MIDHSLVRWIRPGINWDYVQQKRISEVLADYHVGHGKNGHTIFWQIDEHGDVRTGKMMKYYPEGPSQVRDTATRIPSGTSTSFTLHSHDDGTKSTT